jgi:outer membrane lipoprotein SlyB
MLRNKTTMHQMLRALTCAAIVITAAAVTAGGCTTTTTTSQGWGNQPPYYPGAGRTGHVEWIQETVQRVDGNPAAGAVAGAVIGGIIGHALTGGHGDGVVFGAAEGALIGANASTGTAERRFYQVIVRFDDGNAGSFVYEGYPPFQINQPVEETPQGLVPR